MRIILLECKKALLSPIILGLIFLFSVWNIFVIQTSSDFNEDLSIVNEIVEKYGPEFTDESLEKVNGEITRELAELNSITEKTTSQTFDSAFEFFNQLSYEGQTKYTEKQLQSFSTLSIKEMYMNNAKSMDDRYAELDIIKLGESEIRKYGLTGAAADTLQHEYTKFSDRFTELQQNGEHRQWFFSGQNYHMHSLLFGTVFRHLLIEGMILVVLATALITNFEFENRTQLVTYATKRGRKLMNDKLVASLFTASIMIGILFIMTLGTYFTTFDYSYLWNTAISSGFNWEMKFNVPYASWWNWSLLTYLVMGLILSLVCMLLFSLFTFTISVFVKNSYFTFILFAIIFITLFLVPGFIPNSSILKLFTGFNLSPLLLNPGQWWMGLGGLIMFKSYEWMTVLAWTVIYISICVIVLKKFIKEDIS